MKWYKDLYVGESIQHKTEIIKWKIKHNAGQINIFVITIASNPHNLLDIIPAQELMQTAYPKRDLFVVGLAKGREEAYKVVAKIIDEVYRETGSFEVLSYLQTKKDSKNH